jgi:hypothetical protein
VSYCMIRIDHGRLLEATNRPLRAGKTGPRPDAGVNDSQKNAPLQEPTPLNSKKMNKPRLMPAVKHGISQA